MKGLGLHSTLKLNIPEWSIILKRVSWCEKVESIGGLSVDHTVTNINFNFFHEFIMKQNNSSQFYIQNFLLSSNFGSSVTDDNGLQHNVLSFVVIEMELCWVLTGYFLHRNVKSPGKQVPLLSIPAKVQVCQINFYNSAIIFHFDFYLFFSINLASNCLIEHSPTLKDRGSRYQRAVSQQQLEKMLSSFKRLRYVSNSVSY